MRLGVAGLLGDGARERLRAVRDLGFAVASWHLPDTGWLSDPGRLQAAADHLHAEEVELAQLVPPDYPSLVHPDGEVREAGLAILREMLRAARILRAGNVFVRPGSLNPSGPWTPHPDHRKPGTLDRLVASLRALVPHAEEAGIPLALEAHVLSPVPSVAALKEVLDRVGSPWLGVNADPVNLIGTLDQAYHNTALIHEFFDALDDRVLTGHAKDVVVGNGLVLHIEECVPGLGSFDQETFLRRFEAALPRGVLLIEHLAAARVPEARRALLEFSRRAGVHLEAA